MLFRPRPRFNHVLQADARLNGSLTFAGALLMEGQQTGAIEGQGDTSTLMVRGQVTGDVTVTHVYVEGTITGNIVASTLVVKASGRVKGDIKARSIHLEEGGAIDGRLETLMNQPVQTGASSRKDQAGASVARERLEAITRSDQLERNP